MPSTVLQRRQARMEIAAVSSADDIRKWDNYVLPHPQKTPYHLYAWMLSTQQAYGHVARGLVARENDKICSTYSATGVSAPLAGSRASSV